MQEREQMERQLRRAKIQCLILGTAALLLGGIQIWQTSHKEKKTAEVGYRIQTAHPDRGEQELFLSGFASVKKFFLAKRH